MKYFAVIFLVTLLMMAATLIQEVAAVVPVPKRCSK